MKKILFVCSGNTCRSPMAELMLQDMVLKRGMACDVNSAGIMAFGGMPVSSGAQRELAKRGIDASGKLSQQVDGALIDHADLVFAMTAAHKEALLRAYPGAKNKVFTLAEYTNSYRDVSDPYGGDESSYQKCAAQIEDMIQKLGEHL